MNKFCKASASCSLTTTSWFASVFACCSKGPARRWWARPRTGESAVRLYAETNPDVVVMDVSMLGIGGLVALERLMVWEAKARVLMLSAHNDNIVPVRALRLGARGYLCKRAAPEESLRAVGQVAADQRYIDPELARLPALFPAFRHGQSGRNADREGTGWRFSQTGRRTHG